MTLIQIMTWRSLAPLVILTLGACRGRDAQTTEWACKPTSWSDSTGTLSPTPASNLAKSDPATTLAAISTGPDFSDSLLAVGGMRSLGLDVRRGDQGIRVVEGGANYSVTLTRLDGEFPLWAGVFNNCGAGSCMVADLAWGTLDAQGFSIIGKAEDVAPDQPPPLSQVAVCPGELHVVWNGSPVSIRRNGSMLRLVQWAPDTMAGASRARSSAVEQGAPSPVANTTEAQDRADFDLWMRDMDGYALEDGRLESPCNRCERDGRSILEVLLTSDSRNAGPLLADTVWWNEKRVPRADIVRILADEQRQWLRTTVAYAGKGEAIVQNSETSTDSLSVYLARVGRLRTDAAGKAERTRLDVGIAIRDEDGKVTAVRLTPTATERIR